MIKHKRTIPLFLLLTLFLVSCGGGKKKNASKIKEAAYEKAEQAVVKDIKTVVSDIPPPSEIPYVLQATGADFNPQIIHSLDRASSYMSSIDKTALNLGVYATDIGYLSSYDKVQNILEYMETCQKLAEYIGVDTAFDLDLMERFEKNIKNKDSLAHLINHALGMAGQKLQETDRLQTVALILSGSYIEGLYISTMVIDTYPDNLLSEEKRNLILAPLVRIIIDQKKALKSIIKLLKDLNGNDAIPTLVAKFDILNALYDEDLASIDAKISEGDPNFILSKEMLVNVIDEVKKIRTDITQ